MSDADTYEARVRAIRASNQPILEDFGAWLEQSGLSEKTVYKHVYNIRFFTEYLVYYDDPLKRLDQANSSDVWTFLASWFPRKGMWPSVANTKSYMASFKKFFQWMGETGHVSPKTVADVLTTLKDGRDKFLAVAAESYAENPVVEYPWLEIDKILPGFGDHYVT